ncbi:hypothetical protein QEO94_07345 [Kingella negevensis]|uniref:hypothetical protein n=1 Tax=Kingella negevensis TaxID=1522312 RepID=UPI00254321A5|nr:hypothetical protein [Kingella negevensis]WII92459.1 hypothetical protein QEO94_07345 [Kingella negevensis]
MKYRNQFLKYGFHQQAGADGGDGGSGGQGQAEPKTFTQAEVDKLLAKQVAGLKNKNSELIGSLKDVKTQLAQFDGINPDSVRQILKQFADDEEAKLIASGKIDEVLNKRTERMKADHDKTTAKLQGDLDAALARSAKFAKRALSGAVREVGAALNVHATAFEDALLRAKSQFEIDDEGNAIAKDGVYGKDGKPLTLQEWFESMKETAPHWFPVASGGGSSASGSSGSGMPKSLADCKTDEERIAYIRSKTQ